MATKTALQQLIEWGDKMMLEHPLKLLSFADAIDKAEELLSVEKEQIINANNYCREMINDENFLIGLEEQLAKFPYEKHVDDGQYNDGVLDGFELGAEWGYQKAKEKSEKPINLFTMEDMLKCWNTAYVDAMSIDELDYKPTFFEDFIKSLKQDK